MKPARVVGAGLSGLAAAWRLAEAGFDVEVIEATAEPGGLIGTISTPFGPVERAANAFVWNATAAEWFRAMNLAPEFPRDASRNRFILRDGRPRRWPLGVFETASLGAHAGIALVRGRFGQSGDETVADWGARVLGRAAATALLEPALQGIYGATADRLAARAVFGKIDVVVHGLDGSRTPTDVRRARQRKPPGGRSATPADGMGTFVRRLAEALAGRGARIQYGTPVTALDSAVPTVVSTNARAAATLVRPYAPQLAVALEGVEMNALVSATAFFEPHASDVHGFGVLFPRTEGITALGVLFNADIFGGRGPLRSETWICGYDAHSPTPTNDDVAAAVLRDRERFTGRRATPAALYVGGVARTGAGSAPARIAWLPVYDAHILRVCERLGDLPPWLGLAGNYLGRLGVAKLLDVSTEAVNRLAGTTSSPPSHA